MLSDSPVFPSIRPHASGPPVLGEAARRGEALRSGATEANVRTGAAAAAQKAQPRPSVHRPVCRANVQPARAWTTVSLPQPGETQYGRDESFKQCSEPFEAVEWRQVGIYSTCIGIWYECELDPSLLSLFLTPVSLMIILLTSIREVVLVRSLRRLREQIVRANLLVQEACFIAEELERHTEYRVTLQIPSDNLNANRKVSHTHACTHAHTRTHTHAHKDMHEDNQYHTDSHKQIRRPSLTHNRHVV